MHEVIDLPEVEFAIDDSIFIKQMLLERAGTYVPQHSHKYDHTSMLAVGSLRAWKDGALLGDFKAPVPISIKAGCKHTFMSLEPNTVVYCIHNISREGYAEIQEEHEHVSPDILGA